MLERNYRCKLGEIDLICRDGQTLVFVEVRYRSNPRYASAAASIDAAKRRRLTATAEFYLQQKRLTDRVACRFDVLAIDRSRSADEHPSGADEIQWLKNALDL